MKRFDRKLLLFALIAVVLLSSCAKPTTKQPLATAVAPEPIPITTPEPTPTTNSEPTVTTTPVPSPTITLLPSPTVIPDPVSKEAPVVKIPLAGPLANSSSEISGLAWYGDYLILLPQYPHRLGDNLMAIPKADILSFLDDSLEGPLTPQAIPFETTALAEIDGYEGLEALAFSGDRAFFTIEASPGAQMRGYLVAADITPDLSLMQLDEVPPTEILPQAAISNFSDEALMVVDASLVTLYEANGSNVNPAPIAHRFDADLQPLANIDFPTIEYRITDATAVDSNGRFWAINYLYPGDIAKLNLAPDLLSSKYGPGATHAQSTVVERLVEFQYNESGILLTDTTPIQFVLLEDDVARNWEGIVRLPERDGFLLATDKFPRTILAFVAVPNK